MGKNVYVIGDLIVDEYTHGTAMGISAETPTVVAKFEKKETFIGGAGLVVRHLLRLGCNVSLTTVTGESGYDFADQIESELKPGDGELSTYSPIGEGWSISKKSRFFVGPYKMVQYDSVNTGTYTQALRKEVISAVSDSISEKCVDKISDLVICDNRHGVMTAEVIMQIMKVANRNGVRVHVDSQVSQKESNHSLYKGCSVMYLNEKELDAVCKNAKFQTDKMRSVSSIHKCAVVLKLGAAGSMFLASAGDDVVTTKGFCVNAVDTCGAGDAFMAAFVATDDLKYANRWAALSTMYKGTVVPNIKDLSWVK